jgi:TDG/mug DNA glycosylase family protein
LAIGLRLVVCGSAVGARSAALERYYAGPGNKFWRTLYDIGLTPYRLEPPEYRLVLQFGIGLTDLVKNQAGSDADIRFGDADRERLRATILQYQPRYLAFNGKGAAKHFFGRKKVDYGLQEPSIGETALFVAPSTSGVANRWWILGPWQDLARLVRQRAP